MTTTIARIIDAIPVVRDTVERDLLYPHPDTDQRVQNKGEGVIQRYTSLGVWVDDFAMIPQPQDSVFNVVAYGAVGDGTVDDTAAIQAALTAAANGGIIWFPPGYYKVTSQLVTGGQAQRLVGGGYLSSRLLKWHSGPLLYCLHNHVVVDNFEMTGMTGASASYADGSALYFQGSSAAYPVLRNIHVRDIDVALDIQADAGYAMRCSDCTFEPYAVAAGNEGRSIRFQTDTVPSHRTFVNIGSTGRLDLANASSTTFASCQFAGLVMGGTNYRNLFTTCQFTTGVGTATIQGTIWSFVGCFWMMNVTLDVANGPCFFIGALDPGKTLTDNTAEGNCLVVTGPDGYRQTVDGFNQDNVAASQTNVELVRAMGRWRAPRAGSVTAILATATEARTAGTLTLKVYKNTGLAGAAGSQLGSMTAVLDGTNTSRKATTAKKDTMTFAAGDELYITVTTDAGWLPVTSDLRAVLEVET